MRCRCSLLDVDELRALAGESDTELVARRDPGAGWAADSETTARAYSESDQDTPRGMGGFSGVLTG
jgi:hypothetical protein